MTIRETTVYKVLDAINDLCNEMDCNDKVDSILQSLVSALEDAVSKRIYVKLEKDEDDSMVTEQEYDFIRSCKAKGMSNMEILKIFTEIAKASAKCLGDDDFAEFAKMRMIRALIMYED